MFVDIDEPKAPLKVEVMLFSFKKGEENITPEVCFNVLKSTNYKRSIKDMLNCISALPVEEQAQFKDVVLSTFDNREQPNDILVLGKKLAVAGGYEEELSSLVGKVHKGVWLGSSAHVDRWNAFRFGNQWKDAKLIKDKVILLGKQINIQCANFDDVKGLKFEDGAAVNLREIEHLPFDTDFSNCARLKLADMPCVKVKDLRFAENAVVEFDNVKGFPPDLDVSHCSSVYMHRCDLADVQKLHFCEGANVSLSDIFNLPHDIDICGVAYMYISYCDVADVQKLDFSKTRNVHLFKVLNLPDELDFSSCRDLYISAADFHKIKGEFYDGMCLKVLEDANAKLPEILDFSRCRLVNLDSINLAGVREIKFRDGADVNLSCAQCLPPDLDVSLCSKVNLFSCYLGNIKELRFRDMAEVNLRYAEELPDNLDFSRCMWVKLRGSLANIKKLEFREGAEVHIESASSFNQEVDFSSCALVNLADSTYSGKQITFLNEKQLQDSKVKFSDNFDGKVVYKKPLNTSFLEKIRKFCGR